MLCIFILFCCFVFFRQFKSIRSIFCVRTNVRNWTKFLAGKIRETNFLAFFISFYFFYDFAFCNNLFCFRPNWVYSRRERLSCRFRQRSALFLFSNVRKSTFRSARCSLVFHQFYCPVPQPVSTRFCSIVLSTKFLRPAPKTYCGRQLRITFCSYAQVAYPKRRTSNIRKNLIKSQNLN